MSTQKRSFFERLTGSYADEPITDEPSGRVSKSSSKTSILEEVEESIEEGELSIDAYETNTEIIIQAMVAGSRMEDLDVSITQDMVTVKGKRLDTRRVDDSNFFHRELYWGAFGRSILLPKEIDPDEAEATMKNGMLTIKLQKLDRERVQKLKIKNE